MKFRAVIMDDKKRRIGAVTCDTWQQAADKLRDTQHPQRRWSAIEPVE